MYERRLTLAQLMKELPEPFIQISKTTILNIYMVKEINSSLLNGNLYVTLQNTEELLVSRYFSKALKEKSIRLFATSDKKMQEMTIKLASRRKPCRINVPDSW